MTSLIPAAQQLAEQINDGMAAAGLAYKATVDVRRVTVPGVLVVPTPRRDYVGEFVTGCSYTVTWSVFCLAAGPADLAAMRHLDAMAGVVEQIDGVLSAVPASYLIPSLAAEPLPAYQIDIENGI